MRQLDGDVGEAALSYDEVKALASGNPLLLEHAQATADVRRLERLEGSHYSNQSYLHRRAEWGRGQIAELERSLSAYASAKAALTPDFELKVGSPAFDAESKGKGNEALLKAARDAALAHGGKPEWRVQIGRFRGLSVEAYSGWQRGSVFLGLRGVPNSGFELSGSVNAVQRLAKRVESLDKLALQDRFQLQRIEEDVTRADSAKDQQFPKQRELAAARERWKALETALAQPAEAKPSSAQPPEAPMGMTATSAEERWAALVQQQHAGIVERTARVTSALQRRIADLEDKRQGHEATKPSGLRGMLAGAGATDLWREAADRLAKAQVRVERHLEVATRLAQPAAGHYEAPSMRLARRRAARLQPVLAKEVQQVLSDRAAKLAAERAEQTAQVREGRPSLRV